MWFEPLNCMKIIENGKKYHNSEFWFNSNNEFGFSGPKNGFLYMSTAIDMITAIEKELLSGFF